MFSLKLKEIREERGFSQQGFADKLKKSQSTIGMWESGKREPNFETVKEIANILQCSIDYLLEYDVSDYKVARAKCNTLLEQNDIDINMIEKKLVVPFATLKAWIGGYTNYFSTVSGLSQIADVFGVSVDYLLGREEYDEFSDYRNTIRVPVLGTVQAGIPMEAIENIIDYEEISEEMARSGEYFGLRVKGSSMEPKFSEGDVVIVRKQPDAENGEIAIILVNGSEATIKKIKKDSNGIMLIPSNPSYEVQFYTNKEIENKPVQIIGKVVELRAKF